jgi:hypothetical protein
VTRASADQPLPVASFHLFRVRGSGIPRALIHMATDRFAFARVDGLRFWKSMGTGDARTFTPKDADLHLWSLFCVWDTSTARDRFTLENPTFHAWTRISVESARWNLAPLRWKGEWSRQRPFGSESGSAAEHREWSGPVAVLTRARIRTKQIPTFLRAVPPVALDARTAPGLRYSVGIGEAPIGLQATFSVWDTPSSVDAFAYRGAPHRAAIRQTSATGWYAEELFARFGVESATGTLRGASMEVCPDADVSSETSGDVGRNG